MIEFLGLEQKMVFSHIDEESGETKELVIEKGTGVKITAKDSETVIEGYVFKIDTKPQKFFVSLKGEVTYLAYVDPNEIANIEIVGE